MKNYNMVVWKNVKGFENRYLISSEGEVFSLLSWKILKQNVYKGYSMVALHGLDKRKMISVHRYVALAFIPNPENKEEINHKDENPLNNHYKNLQWCDPKENSNWGTRNERLSRNAKRMDFTPKKVRAYKKDCGDFVGEFNSISKASRELNVKDSHIINVCKGRAKSAGGYNWEYVDGKTS